MSKKKKRNIIIVILLLLLLIGGVIAFMFFNKNDKVSEDTNTNTNESKEIPKLKIVDENSKSRPYGVMINNHPTARNFHSGLQDAYIIYEIIVEGGLTRYMALFKDQNTEIIGSVRSARHYFLDYAMENDAYYVHWGWSPQAQSDISSLRINNINGLTYEGKYFYRDRNLGVSLEHTGYTSMKLLKEATEKLKYRSETNKELLLNYSIDEVDLSNVDGSQNADIVTIRYSNSITDKYEYDKENKYYLRFVNGKIHKDYRSGDQYHFKNIITYKVGNSSISGDAKGRQTLNNIGSGEGYYISNGKAVKIKWSKASRDDQTIYTYLDGKEIDVNDGNTFINIIPSSGNINIEEIKEVEGVENE